MARRREQSFLMITARFREKVIPSQEEAWTETWHDIPVQLLVVLLIIRAQEVHESWPRRLGQQGAISLMQRIGNLPASPFTLIVHRGLLSTELIPLSHRNAIPFRKRSWIESDRELPVWALESPTTHSSRPRGCAFEACPQHRGEIGLRLSLRHTSPTGA